MTFTSELILQTAIILIGTAIELLLFSIFVTYNANKHGARIQMILGLSHDRIVSMCFEYIDRGWLSSEEYENLYVHLYQPYRTYSNDTTCDQLIEAVKCLPIKKIKVSTQE